MLRATVIWKMKRNLHRIHYFGKLNLPSQVFSHSNEERLGGSRRVGSLTANCAKWKLIYGLCRGASALTNLPPLIWSSIKSKSNWCFYRRAFSDLFCVNITHIWDSRLSAFCVAASTSLSRSAAASRCVTPSEQHQISALQQVQVWVLHEQTQA